MASGLLRGNSPVGRLGWLGVLRSAQLIRLGDATDLEMCIFSALRKQLRATRSPVISLKAVQMGR